MWVNADPDKAAGSSPLLGRERMAYYANFGLSPPTFSEKDERKTSEKGVTLWQKIA